MALEYILESVPGQPTLLMRVRCSEDQARALAILLDRQYPGRKHVIFPLVSAGYAYAFEIRDTEPKLRARMARFEADTLLGAAAGRPGVLNGHGLGILGTQVRDRAALASSIDAHAGIPAPVTALTPDEEQIPETSAEMDGPYADLAAIAKLPAAEREATLLTLFLPHDAEYVRVGTLLAETYEVLAEHAKAVKVYAAILKVARGEARTALRRCHARALLAARDESAVIRAVRTDESDPVLRAALGVALARLGRDSSAFPHLEDAWLHGELLIPEHAIHVARGYWQRGSYHDAAELYRHAIEHAPADLSTADFAASDFAAIAELARSDELETLSDERRLACIEEFYSRASDHERGSAHTRPLLQDAIELARRVGDAARLTHSYYRLIDDLVAYRDGTGLVRVLEEARADLRQGLLEREMCTDILEDVAEHIRDYRLLRESLIEAYDELLGLALAGVEREGPPSREARDLYRALYNLDRRNPTCERFKKLLASRSQLIAPVDEEPAPPNVRGKRIALVGGHDSTRIRVREQLLAWGARVDEVPPPTSGRTGERIVADRIRSSNLVVLIVSYMGHDMSTIVNNLHHRGALSGEVLPVDCRGATGVMREIARWAERA